MNAISTRTGSQRLRSPLARRALVLVAVLVLGSLALPAAAAVYKWVDTQGRIHYSDLPPPPDGKLLSVDTANTTSAARAAHNDRAPEPVSRSAASGTTPPAATGPLSGPGSNPDAVARLKQAVDADVSDAHADDCKKAQERYQNYVHSRRLYKEGPDKERVYLTDQELETERLQAKHDVDEVCGPGH